MQLRMEDEQICETTIRSCLQDFYKTKKEKLSNFIEALKIFTEPNQTHVISPDLQNRIKPIRQMYDKLISKGDEEYAKEFQEFFIDQVKSSIESLETNYGSIERMRRYGTDSNIKEDVIKAIREFGSDEETVIKWNKDEDIVFESIKNSAQIGYLFKYADKSLRKKESFVLKVIKEKADAYQYVDESLRDTIDFTLKAFEVNGDVFRFVDPKLVNKESILMALKIHGWLLMLLGDFDNNYKQFETDKDCVYEAVLRDGWIFDNINESYQIDVDIIKAALLWDPKGDDLHVTWNSNPITYAEPSQITPEIIMPLLTQLKHRPQQRDELLEKINSTFPIQYKVIIKIIKEEMERLKIFEWTKDTHFKF